ncbi:MAG TPA: hypothetical protein VIV40_33205 [Kofleriaceae bacterium]
MCGFAFVLSRANAVRRTFATSKKLVDVDLDLIKGVARVERAGTLGYAGVCALCLFAIASLPFDVEVRVVLSIAPTMLLVVAAVALYRVQRLLSIERGPDVRALSHGEFLFAARGKKLVGWVRALPDVIAHASSLPIAKLRQ